MQQWLTYFKGKKIFLTGHTGFKGSWLMNTLHNLGAEVTGYALAPEYEGSLYTVLGALGSTHSIIADIRDRNTLHKAIHDCQPDFIFHLAAQPLVRRSYQVPAETFDVNVTGTANVLEGMSQLSKKCSAVIITTDKVYDNREQDVLYNEDDALGGYDPYSASKACAELVVSSFRNSFYHPSKFEQHQKAIASARAGNVIGGGDWSTDRIIPDIVRALQTKQAIEVRNPVAVRPWQHVLEPVAGYLRLAFLLDQQPFNFSKPFNFGPRPSDHLTVRELVETAITSWGTGTWIDRSMPGQLHEAGLLKLDISRAMRELDWSPKLTAREAIDWTLQWYRNPTRTFTDQQIREYFQL